jgi:hypothetical protein
MSRIFVFGSNIAGLHYGGSARHAVEQHGAIMGQGIGRQGNSYAIPTLDGKFQKLPLDEISSHVLHFMAYAQLNHSEQFDVVAIGCGIAGFKPKDIAPMFDGHPDNVHLPHQFKEMLK